MYSSLFSTRNFASLGLILFTAFLAFYCITSPGIQLSDDSRIAVNALNFIYKHVNQYLSDKGNENILLKPLVINFAFILLIPFPLRNIRVMFSKDFNITNEITTLSKYVGYILCQPFTLLNIRNIIS